MKKIIVLLFICIFILNWSEKDADISVENTFEIMSEFGNAKTFEELEIASKKMEEIVEEIAKLAQRIEIILKNEKFYGANGTYWIKLPKECNSIQTEDGLSCTALNGTIITISVEKIPDYILKENNPEETMLKSIVDQHIEVYKFMIDSVNANGDKILAHKNDHKESGYAIAKANGNIMMVTAKIYGTYYVRANFLFPKELGHNERFLNTYIVIAESINKE